MTDASLLRAQQEREARAQEARLDAVIDKHLTILFAHAGAAPGISEADTVGPAARHKLRFLLRFYAKKPHPFTACVHDNMKRFGPGRTERVCATLKDIIRGTTHWRGHPELDHGAPGAIAASDAPVIDEEIGNLLLSLSEADLEILFADAREAVNA